MAHGRHGAGALRYAVVIQPNPRAAGERVSGPTIGSHTMNSIRLVAIALIVAGVLGLAYGGFSYTKDTTVVKLGPMELTAKEQKSVDFPMWASIGALVAGGLLLVWGGKKD